MEEEKSESTMNIMDIEELNPNLDQKTVEATMAAVSSYLGCPVCTETMISPIYQCANGHVVCCKCIERINQCVECRVPLCRSLKIRNIALEKICSHLNVDCSNKTEGCLVNTTVEFLGNHLQVCPYAQFNFCSSVLGWNDCKHLVHDMSVLSHLETYHSITKVESTNFQLCLNVDRIPQNEFLFEPILVMSMEIPILIRSVVSTDGHFNFTGFTFKNENDGHNIRLKFRIESQTKDASFEWSGYVQPYRAFKETTIINSFCIPVASLIEFRGPDVASQEIIPISINVTVWEKYFLSQDDKVTEEVHIFEQSIRQNSEQEQDSRRSDVRHSILASTSTRRVRSPTLSIASGSPPSPESSPMRLSGIRSVRSQTTLLQVPFYSQDILSIDSSPLENI